MDDNHVAQLLAKEARDSSQKYAAEGVGAFRHIQRPASNAPKPNTRFLRHLIKETDTHNLALKRKEERDSRDRMRQLRDQSTADTTSTSQASRQHDRLDIRDSEGRRPEHREERHRSHRRRHRSRSTSTDRDRDRDRRHRRRGEDYDKERVDRSEPRRERRRHESSRTNRRNREPSHSRSRSRSPRRDRTSRHHRSGRHRRRSESPSGTRSTRSHREEKPRRSGHDNKPSRSRLSPTEVTRRETKPPPVTSLNSNGAEDSDPLEDLVGPLPRKSGEEPIRSRGRGAYKPNSSTIDAHFAPDYDPTLDVQLDEHGEQIASQRTPRRPVAGLMGGEDDWDMALEALHDRTHWRQKGEERLRAAGMNDNAIDRWKNDAPVFSGVDGEGKPDDVRWSKKGEGREWDRGKFVNDDGHIDVRAAWQS